MCLAVTCHLHFWQNDQDLLCAISQCWLILPFLCVDQPLHAGRACICTGHHPLWQDRTQALPDWSRPWHPEQVGIQMPMCTSVPACTIAGISIQMPMCTSVPACTTARSESLFVMMHPHFDITARSGSLFIRIYPTPSGTFDSNARSEGLCLLGSTPSPVCLLWTATRRSASRSSATCRCPASPARTSSMRLVLSDVGVRGR